MGKNTRSGTLFLQKMTTTVVEGNSAALLQRGKERKGGRLVRDAAADIRSATAVAAAA